MRQQIDLGSFNIRSKKMCQSARVLDRPLEGVYHLCSHWSPEARLLFFNLRKDQFFLIIGHDFRPTCGNDIFRILSKDQNFLVDECPKIKKN